jgi:hypothetical protein
VFWHEEAEGQLEAVKKLVITIQATVPEAKMIDVEEIEWGKGSLVKALQHFQEV